MTSNVQICIENGIFFITLSREKRLNSITNEMYKQLTEAFKKANHDCNVFLTVIKGVGRYYSAGSDFSLDELSEMSGDEKSSYYYLVEEIINHAKPIIALVHGPAVGIAVTTLALFDMMFFISATFLCPFTTLGLCPEAASSYSFIQSMGYQKAAKMLMFAEKITAAEALECGLVSKVFPSESFDVLSRDLIQKYAQLSPESLLASKQLLRTNKQLKELHNVNETEHDVLIKLMTSESTMERIMKKFTKSKL
ncbi:unnamed protein product [Auanema sp. JU1783]|nr:unnamed protein product [Auanema sp. JU1783]